MRTSTLANSPHVSFTGTPATRGALVLTRGYVKPLYNQLVSSVLVCALVARILELLCPVPPHPGAKPCIHPAR